MNILRYVLLLACVLGLGSLVVKAEELSPADKEIAAQKVRLQELEDAKSRQEMLDREAKKAAWNRLTWGEAMAIRGQAVVDAGQYAGGKAVQGLATVDGYLGAGVAYPVNLVTASAFGLAAGSKEYAAKAWDNEPKVVAAKAPEQK